MCVYVSVYVSFSDCSFLCVYVCMCNREGIYIVTE
jgi:hypothetical protein